MKRNIALILLISILFSSFLSCTLTTDTASSVSDSITVTSSAAEPFARWLTDRLGEAVPNVVIGIGNSGEFDVDMSAFENDGYIIKNTLGGTVIFGKTVDGLDLACRRFANAVDLYGCIDDTVYHEKCRIDELRIFDIPVSEYTAIYPAEYNDIMLHAAQALCDLIENACVVSLPIEENDKAVDGKVICFVLANDEALGEEGFRYCERQGELVFEAAGKLGFTNAVRTFMQNECGWYNLTYGKSKLDESELVNVPVGLNVESVPAFDIVTDVYTSVVDEGKCPSDEQYFAEALSLVTEHVESTSAKMIDLTEFVTHCLCESCEAVIREEGSSAGPMIRFANRISEEISKTHTGMHFNVSLDSQMRIAPLTAPADNVQITYSLDDRCQNHALSETEKPKNKLLTEELKGWLSLTDNVCISLQGTATPLRIHNLFEHTYKDVRYLYDLGIRAFRLPDEENGFSIGYVENLLYNVLQWNISITKNEFDSQLHSILEHEYGDGWINILQYSHLWNTVTEDFNCANGTARLYYDTKSFAECFEDAIYLTKRAAMLACNKEQQKNCELLYAHAVLEGCFSSYYSVYYSADKERIALLDEQYSNAIEILDQSGIDTSDLSRTLYDAAWHGWIDLHDELYIGEIPNYTNTDELMEFCMSVNTHTADDSLTFGFRTDTHYTSKVSNEEKSRLASSYESILRINRYIDLDFIAHGGDIINGNQEKASLALQSLQEITSFMRGYHHDTTHIFLRGNHDDNSWYGYEANGLKRYYAFPADTILTTDQWRETVLSENADGIVTDDSGAYGYFDHEESKIRVLLLDTADLPYIANEDGIYKYGAYTGLAIREAQLQFMADAMTFADKGDEASEWAILVLTHVPVETYKEATSKYRFGGLEAIGRNYYAFLRLLKAYQRGTVFNETQTKATNYGDGGYVTNDGNWYDDSELFSYSVKADYSVNGPGEVIGIISGHTHVDNFSDEVGKKSYSWYNKIYPELSYGYPYFSVGTGGIAVFTVERNGDGTGTIYVDRFGKSTVPRKEMIADGDNAVVTKDKTASDAVSSIPDTGSVASGKYSVNYTQNP